ncbi:MAG: tRNA uridine-5-carboxymethylaminomethyl(34) synthesis enzyme MnmG [Candidatus Omnitrophica bacterium]|nr:tRNA uridine-5-carboxymethylaminomethyl(34) synthesis enzyme MnmG [Candidatus Omnitrophota bacterium]
MPNSYHCIVVGAGHAGIEAALLPARMGVKTLMVNYAFSTIGLMSCNPALGGVGKGQLVRETDILGGEMGRAADVTGIQFRTLNASKGPAVHSSRCQSDRAGYSAYMQDVIRHQPNLSFVEGEAVEVMVYNGRVTGLKMADGVVFEAPNVIITAGTFLNGRIHLGPEITPGGRIDEKPSLLLAENLKDLGFVIRNFKTGTPPRLDGRTIDYSRMTAQYSDAAFVPFSYRTPEIPKDKKLVPCWITETTARTHAIIKENFHLSPMYSGQIDATGVRYCPSIEDKLKKFATKERHPVFIEPDGIDTPVVYPNGISTGLPKDVQEAFVHTIPGLEKAEFIRYGYSIEHGVIYAEELKGSLESKRIAGLFFAGQLNGTTGYEEAAVQGCVAGINAALRAQNKAPFILRRDEAYAGVLIDDLITKGTNEPYRMFTSRVEYRLVVREDNTDERLAAYAHGFGVMSDAAYDAIRQKYEMVQRVRARLRAVSGGPKELNTILEARGSAAMAQLMPLSDVLRRPNVRYEDLSPLDPELAAVPAAVAARVEYDLKYEGFIERQHKDIAKFRHLENIKIPDGFEYKGIPSLSFEACQKLSAVRPATLAQANRISGITPAAITILMIALKKHFAK